MSVPKEQGGPNQRSYRRDWLFCTLLTAVYFGAARLGLALNAVNGFATLVWPPSGIALAVLLLYGSRLWPGVLLGAFLANISVGASPVVALGIGVGNALEALAGIWLLRRLDFRVALDRLRDVVALSLAAAILSPVVAATVGVASLRLGGQLGTGAWEATWAAWWFGDVVGVLVMTPLLLSWAPGPRHWVPSGRVLEMSVLAAVLVTVSVLTFGPTLASAFGTAFFPRYFIFPLLVWACLRSTQRGAIAASFVVAAVAVWQTALVASGGSGAIGASPLENLLYTQSFVAVAAVTTTMLAAIIGEGRRTRQALESSEFR